MTSENGFSIGQRIRQQRERLNWSQERLAESVGATKMSVRRWEHDTVLPQPYYREQLCRVFNVTSEMLFGSQEAEVDMLAPLSSGGIWQVPHLRNPFFTGREEILQRMHTILSHEKTATLTQSYALSGLGGIGKTQTAIEYAYRYAPEYAAVLWVGAETYESLVSSFVTLADMLNLPEKQEQEQKRVVSAVLRWLNSHAEWLLIFDNVEDIELVKGFLPPARSGSLLLTSRRQALGLTAQTLDLEKMTPEEGMRFLLHRARLLEPGASLDQLSTEDKAIAQEIVAAMDGLPLALDQAGAYIEATQCSLRDFLHIFQTHTIHLLNKRDPHADHPTSVVKTFALVFEQLQQVNPQAAELLTMCAFLAPDAIPERLFKEGASQLGDIFVSLVADPWRFNAIFEDLLAYSLIQRSPENKTFTVHRLVQAVLKERIPEEQQRQWISCTTHIINQLFPMQDMNNFKDIEHWPWYEQLLPHAFACTQMNVNGNTSIEELSLLKKMAIYLYVRTRYDEAERLFLSMFQKQSQMQESAVSNRAFVMHGLASTYREQGKYKEAENFYQQAIQLWEQAVEPEELNKATSLIGLADLYRLQGRYAEAEPLYKQSLTLREQILNKAAKLMRLIRQPDERDQEQPPCHERRRIQLP